MIISNLDAIEASIKAQSITAMTMSSEESCNPVEVGHEYCNRAEN